MTARVINLKEFAIRRMQSELEEAIEEMICAVDEMHHDWLCDRYEEESEQARYAALRAEQKMDLVIRIRTLSDELAGNEHFTEQRKDLRWLLEKLQE